MLKNVFTPEGKIEDATTRDNIAQHYIECCQNGEVADFRARVKADCDALLAKWLDEDEDASNRHEP